MKIVKKVKKCINQECNMREMEENEHNAGK